MKRHIYLFVFSLLIAATSCKKVNIRHELSGEWTIEKAEVTYYTRGNLDSTKQYVHPGLIRLLDSGEDEYNHCEYELSGYFPYGWSSLSSFGYFYWFGDPRSRERVTFWGNTIFSSYTRTKHGRGAGRSEEWMYIELDDSFRIATKEILTLKLSNGSGKAD
jgi:hypothetical protein